MLPLETINRRLRSNQLDELTSKDAQRALDETNSFLREYSENKTNGRPNYLHKSYVRALYADKAYLSETLIPTLKQVGL